MSPPSAAFDISVTPTHARTHSHTLSVCHRVCTIRLESGSHSCFLTLRYNIEQAKKALQLFFRSLPEDCYINIMGFGSRFETLWPKSTKYGAKSLEKASRHITTLNANLGGTELANPLQALLAQAPIPGYARQVFVLTDGQVRTSPLLQATNTCFPSTLPVCLPVCLANFQATFQSHFTLQ